MNLRALLSILVAAAVTGACGGQPVEKAYTLFFSALQPKDPPGGVQVRLTVPATWSEELDAMGAPQFKVPDVHGPISGVALAAFPCRGGEGCMERVVGYQYTAEELPATNREPLGADRLFITEDKKLDSGKRRVHARLFARHRASDSIVMCVIFLVGDEAEKLPDLRKVCESLAF